MKTHLIVLIGVAIAGVAWGLESPIGSPTQVPSANRPGLIPSQPNMAGVYGNDVVTGNVGGGKHFRGVVPYGSTYYTDQGFQDFGSREVSDFIRRSVGTEPYYDPRRTVTTLTRQGSSGLEAPTVVSQQRVRADLNPSQAWLDSFDVARMITPPRQAQPLVEPLVETPVLDPRLRDLPEEELPEAAFEADPMRQFFPEETEEGEQRADLLEVPAPEGEPIRELAVSNLYEKIREQLREQLEGEEPETEAPGVEEGAEEGAEGERREESRQAELARAEAPRLRREYGTYRNLAQARYGEYMDLGQRLMGEGQFYKAADAFELAGVWNRDSAVAVLGRSHALFGAGEYMSSAYYLHQALSRDPSLARVRIKVDALVGGRDLYETRVNELTNWQMRSQSGELTFLMAYLMFMDGRTQRASDLAETAGNRMPESAAVQALQQAIANPEQVIQAEQTATQP